MFSARSLPSLLAFFAVAQAAVVTTASPDVAIITTRDRNVTSIQPPPSPFLEASIVTLSPDASEKVVMAAFSANAAIAVAACTLGGPYACISVGITAIIASFFEFWKFSSTSGPIMPLSGSRGTLTLVHPQWQPTAECTIGCQLKAGVEEDTWTHFANVTVKGAAHTMHYYRSGAINGIKAVLITNSSTAAKRADADGEDGIVSTYWWTDGNENAWDSFDTDDSEVGIDSDIELFIQGGNYNAVCADLQDSTGNLDAGIVTIGLNNDILVPENLGANLDQCASFE